MGTSKKESTLYTIFKTVVTALAFAACFYLFFVCFIGTYRQIADIGSHRIKFLNPILILLIVLAAVFALGIYIVKTSKFTKLFDKFSQDDFYKRAMLILKIAIFAECLILALGINGMGQRVDQIETQRAAYGMSWGELETFTPPGYLGIYPNNLGMAVVLYLMSFVTGHYNDLAVILINCILVPFIYSDLASIGAKFGMTRKSQILVMAAGFCFLPLQAKAMSIYGDVPGLFFAVRAMKIACDIVLGKADAKKIAAVISFAAVACVLKNNFLIFAIGITLYLAFEFLRQKRFKDLLIPLGVIVAAVLLNALLVFIVGAAMGQEVSSGASKWSWIAMGMQEEAGMYNGYNALTYQEAGFDSAVQSGMAKSDIMARLGEFAGQPNYAVGFYTSKVMAEWSDPTHYSFELISRNVYLDNNISPIIWAISSPRFISGIASCLKIFQLLVFIGAASFVVKVGTGKKGSPALLLILTFLGGYVFHLIWEGAPSYTLSYMVILIPVGIAGLVDLIKKLSAVDVKKLTKAKISIGSGAIFFIVGALVFLFAAAGLGAIRTQLTDGLAEYRAYFASEVDRTRNPVPEGVYTLKPAAADYDGDGVKVELMRYSGKYRFRIVADDYDSDIFLSFGGNTVDWFSYGEDQVFTILKNKNGTYSICQGEKTALVRNSETGIFEPGSFVNYSYLFDTAEYDEYIDGHVDATWLLVPVS